MALQSTIYKAELAVSDLDRGQYGSHSLTLARHPSETEERMMMRLLAFALYADEALQFGRGVSTEDEPDLWLKDATGAVDVAKTEIQGLREADVLIRKQIDEDRQLYEKRIGYIVTLFEANQKTMQEFINLLKVQNEILGRFQARQVPLPNGRAGGP